MKKIALTLMIVTLIVLCVVMVTSGKNTKESVAEEPLTDNWEIDRELKFHYAYLPKEGPIDGKNVEMEKPGIPNFGNPDAPDITNIALNNILGLGFPLPTEEKPEEYKFYLKFYDFPESIDPAITAERVVSPYLLHSMKSAATIYSYIKSRHNLYVKKGYIAPADTKFSKENPFPAFEVPKEPVKTEMATIPPQPLFDSCIPFSSIYISTRGSIPDNLKEEEKAAWTSKGLIGFHKELLDIYRKNFIEVKGAEPDKYYYFMELSYQIPQKDEAPAVTVFKLPKQPMLFPNYKELPMPHDPERIFLTGLLIVYRNRYVRAVTKEPVTDMIVDSREFKRDYMPLTADLLEVVSVYKSHKSTETGIKK